MKKTISYQGIDWDIGYDWDDDAMSNLHIKTIGLNGSNDIFDYLLQSTIDSLYDALDESLKN